MVKTSIYSKFLQTLNVTNAALEAHRNSILFKPMLSACELELAGEELIVAVHAKDQAEPAARFAIRLAEGRFVVVSPASDAPQVDWHVSTDYLDAVASRPARYFDNPDLLDFDWLKQRVGVA